MDHIVYVDSKAGELEKLLNGEKSMIVRGATGRKLPYGRVQPGDCLYFIQNNAEGLVRASATVHDVLNSEKLTEEESASLLKANQPKLNLNPEQVKRWAGKRFLVLVEVRDIREVQPFAIDRSAYGNMDDWLPVGTIESVMKQYGGLYENNLDFSRRPGSPCLPDLAGTATQASPVRPLPGGDGVA